MPPTHRPPPTVGNSGTEARTSFRRTQHHPQPLCDAEAPESVAARVPKHPPCETRSNTSRSEGTFRTLIVRGTPKRYWQERQKWPGLSGGTDTPAGFLLSCRRWRGSLPQPNTAAIAAWGRPVLYHWNCLTHVVLTLLNNKRTSSHGICGCAGGGGGDGGAERRWGAHAHAGACS